MVPAVAAAVDDATDKKLKVKKSKMKDGSKKDPAKKKRKAEAAEAAVKTEAGSPEVSSLQANAAKYIVPNPQVAILPPPRPLILTHEFPPLHVHQLMCGPWRWLDHGRCCCTSELWPDFLLHFSFYACQALSVDGYRPTKR